MNEIQSSVTPAGSAPVCDAYELIHSLMHAGKQVEMQLDAALAAVGLSAAKWNALRHLTDAGGQLMLGQLAARLSCVKSNATQLVDRLEAEQLVCRLPDATDRRSVRAEITPQGRRAYAQGQKIVTAFEEQLLGAYAPEEQLVLRQMLARMGQAGSLT